MEGMIQHSMRAPALRQNVAKLRHQQPFAVLVVVADAPEAEDTYLKFLLVPGEGFLIGYHSGRHETAAKPLLERCAQVLGYEITLV